jgi:hypothetical protein
MKFNKLSAEEKFKKKLDSLRNWTLVFAWKPVQVAPTQVVWLEKVYRKAEDPKAYNVKWIYKSKESFITDALKDE